MRTCGTRWGLAGARIGAMALLVGVFLGGCGKNKPAAETVEAPPAEAPASSQNGTSAKNAAPPGPSDPRWQQSFAEATIADPPPDWQRPPDTTLAGKSVGKLYTEVVRLWDDVRFFTPSGKRLTYRAILDTEMGPIEIMLRPDWAPNHVRSYIALARAGYFDGLVFQRTVHEETVGKPGDKLDLIEGGCPLGTGDIGFGSIGYWLKPEINPQVSHEEGSVGASHGESADTAACKFYITLSKAPFMDGEYTIFGKITQGLDVARKILTLPVRNDYPDGDRPIKPVVIRKVTIETQEVDNPG